jgi:hypothetical protein
MLHCGRLSRSREEAFTSPPIREATRYRLGIFDPDPDAKDCSRFIGRTYSDSLNDRLLMRETIAYFNKLAAKAPDSFPCPAAYPVRKRKAKV